MKKINESVHRIVVSTNAAERKKRAAAAQRASQAKSFTLV
jgi:hypothetical protein